MNNRNKEIQKKIEKIPVVMLGSFGHAGIDWVHSLLDNHKEILIMPAFSFFRSLDRIEDDSNFNFIKAWSCPQNSFFISAPTKWSH